MYKDLREFIAEVEKLGALRRVMDADPHIELGGITEVAAGMPECPALLFDRIKGYPAGFRIFTNATTNPQRAALALGLDPALRPLDALKAWMAKRQTLKHHKPVTVKDAAFLENSVSGDAVDLRKLPAPVWHAKDGGPYIGSGSIVIMRDPDSGWINASIYRVQVHTRNKVTVQFDHLGRHGAIIARKYWDAGKPCPLAIVNGMDPALFIAGFEYLAAGQSEYEFAGAIKDRAARGDHGAEDRPAGARARRVHPRRRTAVAGAGDAAGRSVRRVHRLLRRRQAAVPGDACRRHPPPQRSDPARLAADEAAALPFRSAVPRRRHLEQPGDGRRHRRGRRLAARRAVDDRGRAQAALRRSRQARRADRRRQQLHGPAGGRRRRGRRSLRPQRRDVGDHHALRAGRADRHRARRLVVGARSAHPGGGQAPRRHLAFQGGDRGVQAVPVDRQVSADVGADAGRGAGDRGQMGRGVAGVLAIPTPSPSRRWCRRPTRPGRC